LENFIAAVNMENILSNLLVIFSFPFGIGFPIEAARADNPLLDSFGFYLPGVPMVIGIAD